jgi:tyrosine-protein kinase Etk/Wzc
MMTVREAIEEESTAALLASTAQVNLLDLLTDTLKGKRTILLFALTFAICGAVLCRLLPPSYTASTEILPPQQQRFGGGAALLSQVGAGADASGLAGLGSAIQAKSSAEMYAAMIAARPIVQTLIERHALMDVYKAKTLTEARGTLERRTTIEATREGMIRISVSDRDGRRAAALANGYVEELRALMHQLALSDASQRRRFYEDRMRESSDDLAQAEASFQRIQQSSGILSMEAQTKNLLAAAAEIRAQLTVKEVQLERMRAYSTDANPDVEVAQREIAALRQQLVQAEARHEGGYSGEGLDRMPEAAMKYLRAARDLKYRETLNDLLARQYESSRLDEARDAPVVQVIEQATPPELASSPKRGMIVAGSALLGALAGTLLLLWKSWRQRLTSEELGRWRQLRATLLHW